MPGPKKPPLEKTIVSKVFAVAKSLGWLPYKNHGNHYSQRGWPDITVYRNGTTAFMEVKRPGHEPTKTQIHMMRRLAGENFPVCVVCSASDARAFLESIPE